MQITGLVGTQNARRLLALGVQINYELTLNNKSPSEINTSLKALDEAVRTGTFGTTLRANTGTAVTASASPQVTDISPTSTPTSPPQSASSRLRSPIIMLIAIGLFYIL